MFLGAKYAPMWAAIAPSAGAVAAWSYPYARMRDNGVAMLMIHGDRDEHVNPHWSRVIAGRAGAAGVDAGFIELPGAAHSSAGSRRSRASTISSTPPRRGGTP